MKLVYLIILLIGVSCGSKTAVIQESLQSDKTILETALSSSKGRLLLHTTIDTSLNEEEVYPFKYGVIKQELFFYLDGKVVNRCLSSMPFSSITRNNGDSVKILENVIYELGILKGGSYDLYSVKGAGLCNSCPEYFAFYTMAGDCVWSNYSSKYKVFKSTGDFNEACINAGIDSIKWFNNDYKKIEADI
jgi:hypothetical protein